MKRVFSVSALWDEEARVYYCESDIEGLHIEAETIDEFQSLIGEYAPDLILSNHLRARDLASVRLGELIPAIVVRVPERAGHPA